MSSTGLRDPHSLAWLATAENRIVERNTGRAVLFRGINRSGMEYCGEGGEQWTESEFDRLVFEWGANVLRIPLNQEWALASENYDPACYLDALDRTVTMAAQRGAYTVLALQWLDNHTIRGYGSDCRPNFVPPLPNAASLDLWQQLATRYRREPAVLYDIFTEPHDVLPGDEDPPASGKRVTMAIWQKWARALIEAIREVNPDALIFVSGVNWAYDLRGHPIPGVEGVVYSTHVYRNKGRNWDEAFGELSTRIPVVACEWGGTDEDVEWGNSLANYFAAREIGWMVWGWPDWPPLIEPDYTPTPFGRLVQLRLVG